MYSDLTAFGLASDNLFSVTGDSLIGAGLGTFRLDSDPLAEAAFALPFNLSGAWVTSFSNLSLPAGIDWRLASDRLAPSEFQYWGAALPHDFEAAPEAWMTSFFSDLLLSDTDYWELLRDPLGLPDIRYWVAELPPAFEMARDWGPDL
jgi:hypothetical protein